MNAPSSPELLLAAQLEQAHIPFTREYAFALPRKYRADFAVIISNYDDIDEPLKPLDVLLVEVEGGTWISGRHSRGSGFESDCEKQALAVIAGYRYMRLTSSQVEDGRGLEWIRKAMDALPRGGNEK